MYTLVRMGNGTKAVDNISSGGMYAPVDENGVIFKPAFCDKTGELYEIHPFTKTKLVGFQIPFYAQAVEMVFEAAQRVPQVGYVGWDVAMAEDGPLLIEGNTMPGYDMPQNYYHLRMKRRGFSPGSRRCWESGWRQTKRRSLRCGGRGPLSSRPGLLLLRLFAPQTLCQEPDGGCFLFSYRQSAAASCFDSLTGSKSRGPLRRKSQPDLRLTQLRRFL